METINSYLVKFSNVGARKLTWEQRINRPITDEKLYRAVKKRKALGSRGIEFTEDTDWGGKIYVGGLRHVGDYFIDPASGQSENLNPGEGSHDMEKIGVDPTIYDLATRLAEDTFLDLRLVFQQRHAEELAEALQRAFENWAIGVESKEPSDAE